MTVKVNEKNMQRRLALPTSNNLVYSISLRTKVVLSKALLREEMNAFTFPFKCISIPFQGNARGPHWSLHTLYFKHRCNIRNHTNYCATMTYVMQHLNRGFTILYRTASMLQISALRMELRCLNLYCHLSIHNCNCTHSLTLISTKFVKVQYTFFFLLTFIYWNSSHFMCVSRVVYSAVLLLTSVAVVFV